MIAAIYLLLGINATLIYYAIHLNQILQEYKDEIEFINTIIDEKITLDDQIRQN
jgi:hypothetical protein